MISDNKDAPEVLVALFVIGPSFCLPPVESCRGTIPIQAAKSRPDWNAFGSATMAAMVVAPKSRCQGWSRAGYSPRSSASPSI
jgi:hypothetical protein